MAEENLKVNEFEHGTDGPYNVHRSFQQIYGPETNYSYRADSVEEILSDPDKLKAMILNHYQVQCPRLAALDDYMKARNNGIYDDDCRRTEKERADHRAAHNFAKVINVFDVGYNTGVPIKKVSEMLPPVSRRSRFARTLNSFGSNWYCGNEYSRNRKGRLMRQVVSICTTE